MVETLLSLGCDMNEKIEIYEGRTAWELYLALIYEYRLPSERYSRVTWLLINRGAMPIKSCLVNKRTEDNSRYSRACDPAAALTMYDILNEVFGEDEARAMCDAIKKNKRAKVWWLWPLK